MEFVFYISTDPSTVPEGETHSEHSQDQRHYHFYTSGSQKISGSKFLAFLESKGLPVNQPATMFLKMLVVTPVSILSEVKLAMSSSY